MPSYLELYNLELTGDPYAARFIALPEEELPPECVLPIEVPYTPPVFDLTLPDLECKFDVETPIIPLPYFCTPSISGSIGISVLVENEDGECVEEHPQVEVTGSAGIGRVPGTECDYALEGGFSLCLPCIPKIFGEITVDANCSVNGPNPTQVTTTTPIGITYNAETCEYKLEGAVSICTECIPEYTFTSSTTTVGEGSYVSGISMSLVETGDDCAKNIDAEMIISYGEIEDLFAGICWVENVTVGSIVTDNTIEGEDEPFVDLNFVCTRWDEDDPECCREHSLGGLVTISACSKLKMQAHKEGERPSLDMPIKLGDATVGNIKMKLDVAILECRPDTDPPPDPLEETPCCKQLQIVFTEYEATLDLGNASISLCTADGGTQEICVLVDPRGCSSE